MRSPKDRDSMSDTGHKFGCLHAILIVLGGGSKPGLWRDVLGWLVCPSFICSAVIGIQCGRTAAGISC